MTLALLFPGQGVQHAQMLPWLTAEPHATAVLDAMAVPLGRDWRERLVDDAWASDNRIAQPLITGVSLAAWAALAPHLPPPGVVAGYSVGELAAGAVAGLYDAPTALQLATQRAESMSRSAGAEPAGLSSVRGVDAKTVDTLCARFGVAVAIRIDVDRCVIGGALSALASITPELVGRGGELTPLRVYVASHTPAMAAAAQAFATIIEPLPWPRSRCVVACNIDGAGRRDPASLKDALARQIAHTVEWGRCLDTVAERRPRCVLEVGPGTSLSRMWASAHPDVPARSVDEFQSAGAVISWVRQVLGGGAPA